MASRVFPRHDAKPGRLHRRLLAIVEIAGKQERIDILVDAEIDDPGIMDQTHQI